MSGFLVKRGHYVLSHRRYICTSARLGISRLCVSLLSTRFPIYSHLIIGNSRLPQFSQTNLINLYLFHADSGDEVLRVTNQINPTGLAGSMAKQVNDSWFPNGGLNFNGSPVAYTYYWVITRADQTLDGTEIPQATFTAVRE